MNIPIFQVDAFTTEPFKGNPAGVCLLREAADPAWMQNVAKEMNLSETAFLVPRRDGFDLRWFTPQVEVELCGHATLSSAHVLWEEKVLAPDQTARFQTVSGLLTATRDGEWIELDFPARPPRSASPDWTPDLVAALGVKPSYIGLSKEDVIVEVADEATVRKLEPDIAALAGVPARGVIVTSRAATPGFDFVSRFFAPAVGIAEDPVTGSSHTVLAPFWTERLRKPKLAAYQASARGGVLRVRLAKDRVKIAGQAVTVIKGELRA
ncbi:MAG: PhzF family phenazine biosynthesis protein [Candidatus Aminicenantes bacterium]|nr:PhzF family phenazine biosynthesis protein [Candidatus Aminicenantes bacterium]